MAQQRISTPFTEQFGLKHAFCLAGMSQAAGPELAAAVTNAGGLGMLGGVRLTPKFLRRTLEELKENLNDKNAPFGVDLLLPQVGGNARKTNYDYTHGELPQLIDLIIEFGAKLFVSAVGSPPKWVVDKLHDNGILVAGIIGHPKHAKKVLDAGVDLIIAQGAGSGGHSGEIPFSILVPRTVEMCKGYKGPLTKKPIIVLAAGTVYRGRSLAASLAFGADGVWVGTAMVCSEESGASRKHKEAIVAANHESDVQTLVFTGRPLRVLTTPYIQEWERQPEKIRELTSQGIVPHNYASEQRKDDDNFAAREWPFLAGKVSAVIHEIRPAKDIIEDMTKEAIEALKSSASLVVPSRL